MSNGLSGELRTAISSIQSKSAEVSSSDFLSDVASARVTEAKGQISFAKSGVDRNQRQLDDIEAKLNPPPTKEVPSGKGGSKTVVDTEEVRKLESMKGNASAELEASKAAVAAAESEAQTASIDALNAAGLSKEKQTELDSILTKIDSLKDTLEQGGTVSEDELKKTLGRLNKALEGVESNGILKETVFKPIEEDLQTMLKLIDTPAKPATEAVPAAGTVNRDLYDVGIKGDKNTALVKTMTDFAAISESFSNGGTVSKEALQGVRESYMSQRENFTSDQLASSVIKDFESGFDNLVESSGSDVAKIGATAGAGN